METLRLKTEDVPRAAALLRAGGTVAFATETVYGLGANALDEAAVKRIFAAKERPGWDPLIVHVCDEQMLWRVVDSSVLGPERLLRLRSLMDAFWPGPLTLLLPKNAQLPMAVTAGRSRVGVRMPAHPVALELIRSARLPVAAPSANRFGRTSPTTAAHVLEDLEGRIDAVLDSGPTVVGVESTVLDVWPEPGPDVDSERMVVYRPGAVTLEQIRAVAGEVRMYAARESGDQASPEGLPSPGVGMRHYAPRARLMLVEGEAAFRLELERLRAAGERIGAMLPPEWTLAEDQQTLVYEWASMAEGAAQAQRLFAGLRELDMRGATVIVCPLPRAEGVGLAMRDRLQKAARKS